MTETNQRYSGLPTTLYSYSKEVAVVCPSCHKEASVTAKMPFEHTVLFCEHCSYTRKKGEMVRYNAVVRRACDTCGKPFEITIPGNKKKIETLNLPCPHCGTVRTYQPRNDAYSLAYAGNLTSDPVFNLPLWFQCDIKGQVFWAFNRQHLLEIRNYVASKLRERQTATHTTMVERLPQFLKAAKNRIAILKALDKLLKK